MQPTNGIQRLCESWWENLSKSTRDDQYRFAEKFLALLGLSDNQDIEPAAVPGQPATISYVLRHRERNAVVCYFVLPGVLDPPGSVVKRGLDFCDVTRALVDNNRLFRAPYAFITDLFRFYLYDARTDDLLVHADTPSQFVQEFGDVLHHTSVAEGELDEIRRQPRSYSARLLREWIQRWSETLEVEWQARPEVVGVALDRLVALRYLIEHDVLRGPDWSLAGKLGNVISSVAGAPSPGCGKRLTALFAALHRDWNAALFVPNSPVEALFEQDALTTPLLREFVLLSRAKFTIPTILESFNFGDAAEKARVRMIPEENVERQAFLAQQTFDTIDKARIELDVEEEGYRAIFHWLDRLLEVYDRLESEFDASSNTRPEGSKDLDLFGWSEIDSKRPKALTDGMRHAIEKGLVIYCSTQRQMRTARLLLHLNIVARHEKARARFDGFPNIEAALQQRPRVMDTDRRRIFGQAQESEWEVI